MEEITLEDVKELPVQAEEPVPEGFVDEAVEAVAPAEKDASEDLPYA